MNAHKKSLKNQSSPYQIAATARRLKIAAEATETDELAPSNGRIRITLGGNTLSREYQAKVFGPSSIDIPEFALARKKVQK